MLTKYTKDNGFENVQVFVDDGYSGTNFNRPGFQQLLDLMEQQKISKPSVVRFRNERVVGAYTDISDEYGWSRTTVAKILNNEIYIGNTVNCQLTTISYKDKRKKLFPKRSSSALKIRMRLSLTVTLGTLFNISEKENGEKMLRAR